MKKIPLQNGRGFALVDDEEFARLSLLKWTLSGGYAATAAYRNGKRTTTYMHRLILQLGASEDRRRAVVDHLNQNRLDNRKENLRVCSQKENLARQKPRNGRRFKGTSRLPYGRWLARLGTKSLGCFATEEEAARKVDEAAAALDNPPAWRNFPVS